MAGKGGGAWKVAYADFVTAMMAFFMVMWLTSQKPSTKEAIENYFRDPWAKTRLNSNRVRDPTIREQKAGMTNPMKKYMGSDPMLEPHDEPESPDSSRPKVTTVRSTERSAVGTVIYFAEGSTELNDVGRRRLKDLIPRIEGFDFKIEIRAHASKKEQHLAGTSGTDWDGCYQRSMVVMNDLVKLGIAPERLRISQAGGHEPLSLGSNADENAKNVRVEVFMLSETVDSYQGSTKDRANRILNKGPTRQEVEAASEEKASHKEGDHH